MDGLFILIMVISLIGKLAEKSKKGKKKAESPEGLEGQEAPPRETAQKDRQAVIKKSPEEPARSDLEVGIRRMLDKAGNLLDASKDEGEGQVRYQDDAWSDQEDLPGQKDWWSFKGDLDRKDKENNIEDLVQPAPSSDGEGYDKRGSLSFTPTEYTKADGGEGYDKRGSLSFSPTAYTKADGGEGYDKRGSLTFKSTEHKDLGYGEGHSHYKETVKETVKEGEQDLLAGQVGREASAADRAKKRGSLGLGGLRGKNLRRAMVWKEILDAPLSQRRRRV